MLMEMKTSNDAKFSELLGVDSDWTGFLYSQLSGCSWRRGGIVDDMFVEIVNDILINFHERGRIYELAEEIKANTVGDDEARLDAMQRLMNRAVRFRFRDYRREVRFDIGRHSISDDEGRNWFETVADNHLPEHSLEADGMAVEIRKELSRRESLSQGFPRTVLEVALKFFPDRCEGMGIRDLCEKHNIPKGRKAGLALKEIISAAETVINRIGSMT